MNLALHVLFFLTGWLYVLYQWGWCLRVWGDTFNWRLWKIGNHICAEMRPLALFAIPLDALHYLATSDDSLFWRFWSLLFYSIYYWLCLKDKHDDRWKKRRKRAAAKVKEINGRLVVVPTPAMNGA